MPWKPAAEGESNKLLEVHNLRIRFGGFEAVRGISFELAPGETLGLVGESGSGKSATSLALMRLLPASATVTGEVSLYHYWRGGLVWEGKPPHLVRTETGLTAIEPDLTPQSGDLRAMAHGTCSNLLTSDEKAIRRLRGSDIAMIFQEPMTALNPVMTVGRQIAEALLAHHPRTPRAEVRARVLAAMHEVALPDPEKRIHDYPHQFSGGQRQRIVIAMALINRPRLVIADEPTTALDVTVQAQILALLRSLRAQYGLAMLFISHDLAVVGQIADRIAVMQRGEIVETGAARDVLLRPAHAYTRQLLAALPTMATDREKPLAV